MSLRSADRVLGEMREWWLNKIVRLFKHRSAGELMSEL